MTTHKSRWNLRGTNAVSRTALQTARELPHFATFTTLLQPGAHLAGSIIAPTPVRLKSTYCSASYSGLQPIAPTPGEACRSGAVLCRAVTLRLACAAVPAARCTPARPELCGGPRALVIDRRSSLSAELEGVTRRQERAPSTGTGHSRPRTTP